MKKLIFIIGPPAVGKMTVGQELVKKKEKFLLFHNHHSIELAIDLFEFGSEDFNAVNEGIRNLVFETVAKSKSVNAFIFTFVLAFNEKKQINYLKRIENIFKKHKWESYFIELFSPLETRQNRNITENRLKHKRTKRNIDFSNKNLLEMENKAELNSKKDFNAFENFIRINNTNKSAEEVAEIILKQI